MLLTPASAWAYRPFVSTDAAVADPREVEVELGYFNLERSGHENTIATPSVVLNYGVAKRLELVGEFRLDVSPDVELIDPALSLKAVLGEGVLQDRQDRASPSRLACCYRPPSGANEASAPGHGSGVRSRGGSAS